MLTISGIVAITFISSVFVSVFIWLQWYFRARRFPRWLLVGFFGVVATLLVLVLASCGGDDCPEALPGGEKPDSADCQPPRAGE